MAKTKGQLDNSQQNLLRRARKRLGVNTQELAAMLGKSYPSLRSWLQPATNKSYRKMPDTAKLLLKRILEDRRAQR